MATARWNVVQRIFPLMLLAVITCGGCSDDTDRFKVIPLEGRIEKITLKPDGTGAITVRYYSDKHRQEVVGEGRVAKETEILINGVVANLKDLREGDRIRGQVRVEKKRGLSERIALKIIVHRPKPVGGVGG